MQAAIKDQFDQRLAVFRSNREWQERAVAELLGPIFMQLDRTKRAFDRYREKNLYLEAKVLAEGNRTVTVRPAAP